jgi:4-diphosphocytidyl-2-C-methyl-D-erythritol kinase
MIVFPNIKLNLGLHVVAKRADGYHNIETVFYPVEGLSDVVEIVPCKTFIFKQSGINVEGVEEDNLCVKAYRLLAEKFDIPPVEIHLHKTVPTGAGLGGGSSDAAFTLLCLNRLFNLNLDAETLKSFAFRLGSDCAFFILNRPSFASGRGEILKEISLDLQRFSLLIVKPQTQVGTAEAYAGIIPRKPAESLFEVISSPVNTWKNRLINDFESSVFRRFPEIKIIKNQLYEAGAIYASMSGSGASVFGLFEQNVKLKNLQNQFANCWTFF